MNAQSCRQLAAALAGGETLPGWQPLVSSAQAGVFFNREQGAYLKLFYETLLRKKLRSRLLPPLARHRQFVRKSERLRELGFTAPAVLACGELQDSTHGRFGYVLTEAYDGMGLGSFASQYLVRSRDDRRLRQWKRKVMEALGAEVARLHACGISHGDLRPDNILLSCVSPQPRFCFIDNERNRQHVVGISNRARVKNLSQLNMIWSEDLSATYRLRFMKSYLAHSTGTMDGKRLMRRVAAITARRLHGKARGGYLKADQRQMSRPDFDRLLAHT